MANNPFEQPIPVSNDELTAYLQNLNGQSSPFLPTPTAPDRSFKPMANPPTNQVEGGTKAGIDRVNANSDNTGVAGYRDSKGQAVFTQVRDAATGMTIQKQVPTLFKPFGTPQVEGRNAEVRKPEVSTGIQNALLKIREAKTYDDAAGVYTAFKETISAERARLEQEAFSFAESKLGIPAILTKLEQTRMADRASIGWYPGIGDSPVTQKVLAELMQARNFVDNEVKNYLQQNVTYKTLSNYEEQGKMYLNHVDKVLSTEDRLIEVRKTGQMQATFNNDLRDKDRQERQKEELFRIHEGMTTKQIAYINMLEKDQLANFDPTDPASMDMKKLKEASILRGKSKDKDFVAAISAESSQQLLSLAAQGNAKAKTLLLMEESNAMGIPSTEVDMQFSDFNKLLRSKTLVMDTLKLRGDKDAKKKAADFNAALFSASGKPEEVAKINNERIGYAMEYMQHQRTEQFISDVRTWKTVDPLVNAAIDRAVKTSGKASIEGVIGAYLEGSKDSVERAMRLKDFSRIMRVTAAKQANSAFGMPDYRKAETYLNQRLASELSSKFGDYFLPSIPMYVPILGTKTAVEGLGLPSHEEVSTGIAQKYGFINR